MTKEEKILFIHRLAWRLYPNDDQLINRQIFIGDSLDFINKDSDERELDPCTPQRVPENENLGTQQFEDIVKGYWDNFCAGTKTYQNDKDKIKYIVKVRQWEDQNSLCIDKETLVKLAKWFYKYGQKNSGTL